MSGHPTSRTPSFFRQGCLILLPVLVLTTIGFYSLRQDKRLVEQEARTRAREIADTLAAEIWKSLPFAPPTAAAPSSVIPITSTNENLCIFHVETHGRLIFPLPYSAIPAPQPFDLQTLSPLSAELWATAQVTTPDPARPGSGAEAWERFLATLPPEPFASAAEYALGLDRLRQPDFTQAVPHLMSALQRAPDAVMESGLPLSPLAQIRLLEICARSRDASLASVSISLETLCSNIVHRPSGLTSRLMEMVRDLVWPTGASASAAQSWWKIWQRQEQARALYETAGREWFGSPDSASVADSFEITPRETAADRKVEVETRGSVGFASSMMNLPSHRIPECFWIEAEGSWLARRFSLGASSVAIVCLREPVVRQTWTETLQRANRLPPYFDVALEIAGKVVLSPAPTTALRATTISPLMPSKSSGAGWETTNEERATAGQTALIRPTSRDLSNPVKVSVYLTNPDLLYAHQRQRAFWFGSLLAAAAAAALIGFTTARIAFHRQLRLNELKTNFVSSVSHELRAPIASVRLMAEGLESGRVQAASKQREYFGFIVQECRRLSSLIENVLDFSRIEQGRKQYEMEPTDVVALVRQTVALMKPHAAERAVCLSATLDDPASLSAGFAPLLDGRAMQQALINLIDNALKHSAKDAAVMVGLEMDGVHESRSSTAPQHAPAPPPRLRLWVEDHGDGIPAEEHERIFERFYRVGSELRRKTPGVGIGLSIVRHIAEAHGGRVTVRSAPGQGSRFTIEWPIRSHPVKPDAPAPSSEYA